MGTHWINKILLNGQCFWEIRKPTNASGCWAHMLDIRDEVRRQIKEIDTGENTYFCHDCHIGEEQLAGNMVRHHGNILKSTNMYKYLRYLWANGRSMAKREVAV